MLKKLSIIVATTILLVGCFNQDVKDTSDSTDAGAPVFHLVFSDSGAKDISANKATLTSTDVISEGEIGTFNGNTSNISVEHLAMHDVADGSFSITFWYNAEAQDCPILSKYRGGVGAPETGWNIQLEEGNGMVTDGEYRYGVRLDMSDGTNGEWGLVAAENQNVFDLSWHYVAIVVDRDAEVASIYFDNEKSESVSILGFGSCESGADIIVGWRGDYWNHLAGKLGDIRLYDYALTDAQISSIQKEFN